MNTPDDDTKAVPDSASDEDTSPEAADTTIPTVEELNMELSDDELRQRNIVFATRYLLYKAITEKGYPPRDTINFRAAETRLEQLFPERGSEWEPSYFEHNHPGDKYSPAFVWAKDMAYNEWKIGIVKGELLKRHPDWDDAGLRSSAIALIDIERMKEELIEIVKRELGII